MHCLLNVEIPKAFDPFHNMSYILDEETKGDNWEL